MLIKKLSLALLILATPLITLADDAQLSENENLSASIPFIGKQSKIFPLGVDKDGDATFAVFMPHNGRVFSCKVLRKGGPNNIDTVCEIFKCTGNDCPK